MGWFAAGWLFGLITAGMLIALADQWTPPDEKQRPHGWKQPNPERIERDRWW